MRKVWRQGHEAGLLYCISCLETEKGQPLEPHNKTSRSTLCDTFFIKASSPSTDRTLPKQHDLLGAKWPTAQAYEEHSRFKPQHPVFTWAFSRFIHALLKSGGPWTHSASERLDWFTCVAVGAVVCSLWYSERKGSERKPLTLGTWAMLCKRSKQTA